MGNYTQLIIFLALTILLYITSRSTLYWITQLLRKIFSQEKAVFVSICVIFFPGTVIHEMSHFIMAVALLLKVRAVSLWPEFQGNSIRLGHVLYEKKDPVRGILVGVAPLIIALTLAWVMMFYHLFPLKNIVLNILLLYFAFTVSTTMFSSKQDLVDLGILAPFIFILVFVIYFAKINLSGIFTDYFLQTVSIVLSSINIFLLFSVAIHVILIASIRILLRFR